MQASISHKIGSDRIKAGCGTQRALAGLIRMFVLRKFSSTDDDICRVVHLYLGIGISRTGHGSLHKVLTERINASLTIAESLFSAGS